MLAAAAAVGLAAGCGGAHIGQTTSQFAGEWTRVDDGRSNPDFTLSFRDSGGTLFVTFANAGNGEKATVSAMPVDGALTCEVPNDAGESPAPAATPGVPRTSKLEMRLDGGDSRLLVDLILDDGTRQPIWTYVRTASTR
jgi:hypothetical protein